MHENLGHLAAVWLHPQQSSLPLRLKTRQADWYVILLAFFQELLAHAQDYP